MPVVPFDSSAAIGSVIPYQMENDAAPGGPQQEYFCYNNITRWGSYTGITTAAAHHDPFVINTNSAIPDRYKNLFLAGLA